MSVFCRGLGIRWTVGRRLAGLGVVVIAALAVTGVIGYRQAGRAAEQSVEALTVGHALATTIDAQHTASVVLAAGYRLTRPLTAAQRQEVVAQLDEHAGELRKQLTTLRATTLSGDAQHRLDEFLVTIPPVLDGAAALDHAQGVPDAALLGRLQSAWDGFDVASDGVKTRLADDSARLDAVARAGARAARRAISLITVSAIPLAGRSPDLSGGPGRCCIRSPTATSPSG
jgi:hypothetical protein